MSVDVDDLLISHFSFSKNALSGGIPPEIRELENLKSIQMDSNLMAGELSMLSDLTNLEYLDFSNNYFDGSLPLFGSKQRSLRVANLNNNQFSGAIPSGVEELTGLKELMVYGNKLTGSLPSQLGMLHNISKISFSYNILKGSIPTELSNMRKLDLLHLHSNKLVGKSDHFDYSIKSYITDCGLTQTSQGLTQCLDCTECCNIDGSCITTADTWPRNYVKNLGVSPAVLVILFAIGFSSLLIGMCTLFSVCSSKLPRLPYVVRQEFQQASAYRWFLSSFKFAWFWAALSVGFQTWIIITFLQAGDYSYDGNLWIYSIDCPSNKTECVESKTTTNIGWATFVGILAVFLLQDLIPGALIFYESSVDFNLKGIFAGVILMNITILSTVASTIFLYATSLSNIAIIQDAVIVLFLNSIDEQVFMIIQRVAPGWTDDIEAEIMNFTPDKLSQEISEVIIDDDDFDQYAPYGHEEVDVKEMFDTGDYDSQEYDDDEGHKSIDYMKDSIALSEDSYGENSFRQIGDGQVRDSSFNDQDDFEAMKQQLITEVMGIYDNDKAQFMEAHKADTDRIMEELKVVKEENAVLKDKLSGGKDEYVMG